MAYITKTEFDELYNKFKRSPKSLNVNQYKTLIDSARRLCDNGEISIDLLRKVMAEVSQYGNF